MSTKINFLIAGKMREAAKYDMLEKGMRIKMMMQDFNAVAIEAHYDAHEYERYTKAVNDIERLDRR